MSIEWKALNDREQDYRSLEIQKSPSGKTVDGVLFVGLQVKLSELAGGYARSGSTTLTVFADTLVVDIDTFPAAGNVIVARSIDVGAMPGGAQPIKISRPASDVSVVEILAASVTGGQLEVAGPDGVAHQIPTGASPLQAALVTVDRSGAIKTEVKTDSADITDLTGRVYALNSQKASFGAATWLMSSDNAESTSLAREMLAWVAACTASAASGNNDYAALYRQATPLLMELNVSAGATFVPSLSSAFYNTEVGKLLDALDSYDQKISQLQTATNIKQAIATVSASLGDVAGIELQPLQTQQAQLVQSLQDLATGISSLALQFDMQTSDIGAKWQLLLTAITDQQVKEWLEACFGLAISAIKIGADGAKAAEGDAGALKDVATETLEAGKTAIEAIIAVSEKPGEGQEALLSAAKDLVAMEQKLLDTYAASANAAAENEVTNVSLFAIDPALSWNNYMAEANASLSGMSLDAAKNYLASLTILANYGKAIAVKIATASGQQARLAVVKSQIQAAKDVAEQWKALEARAESDEERLAGLIGMLESRADGVRRSVFVSWTHYRDAYYYLYFANPPVSVNLDMSTAALRTAFAETATWIGELLGDDPSGKRINLPDENVEIAFQFDVVGKDAPDSTIDAALVSPATSTEKANLTWAIPIGTDQLKGVLPDGGHVAIWITKAAFFLDGITANNRGNVLTSVSTSGTYENGFGPQQAHAFEAKSMVGNYEYIPATGKVYNAWAINTDVYMTPTPFTQWRMEFDADGGDPTTATKLTMNLTVSFRSKP